MYLLLKHIPEHFPLAEYELFIKSTMPFLFSLCLRSFQHIFCFFHFYRTYIAPTTEYIPLQNKLLFNIVLLEIDRQYIEGMLQWSFRIPERK